MSITVTNTIIISPECWVLLWAEQKNGLRKQMPIVVDYSNHAMCIYSSLFFHFFYTGKQNNYLFYYIDIVL